MRILISSDAWLPQTNGVVSTLRQTVRLLEKGGHRVRVLSPQDCRTVPCPGYPEISLALNAAAAVSSAFGEFDPEAVHVATEGPLGLATRAFCVAQGISFTTSYHTQFPQYLRQRLPVPRRFTYAVLRWFHSAGRHCMVSTHSIHTELSWRGFRNLVRWQRGVDSELFRPREKGFLDWPRPIAAYVGRLAVEKNIDAFLAMPWDGTKLLIGDGPERARLQRRYPHARFVGYRHGEDLACHLAAADVMVFPSRTDTFGLVNLEALACGVPVAAYPVPGPIDIVEEGVTGALDENLAAAARRALGVSPAACRERALRSDWEACTRQFESNLVPA